MEVARRTIATRRPRLRLPTTTRRVAAPWSRYWCHQLLLLVPLLLLLLFLFLFLLLLLVQLLLLLFLLLWQHSSMVATIRGGP
jgi:hypothetical protein